jgi:glycosyltransferase involved in cell wall biosynthesis
MPRIAYLTYSTAEFDGRTQRMARTALEAGYEVIVYARWQPGLPAEEHGPGYRIVRSPAIPALAFPWRRSTEAVVNAIASVEDERVAGVSEDRLTWVPGTLRGTRAGGPIRAIKRRLKGAYGTLRTALLRPFLIFPLRPMGWAVAVEHLAEPADIWHGMWAGSLPALHRLQKRHGGRTVYDSRDVYMRSRGFEQMGALKAPFAWLERRWARRANAVLTVNDAYSALLASQFRIATPPVVRNTPDRYVPPTPRPDLIRETLRVDPSIRVVLYQGGLLSDRGIEQGMEAILLVDDAVFAIMGVGKATPEIARLAASDRMRGRVHLIDAVSPERLLDWTASADVMLMAIQPTSVNHSYTTPQKLWEAIAAGVPVVASDLPGMAEIVRDVGAGELVDATDPTDIARGIRAILDLPAEQREAMRARIWQAGQDRYNWDHETEALLALYRRLLGQPGPATRRSASESISAT